MCGIIAVLQRRTERPASDLAAVVGIVRGAAEALDRIAEPILETRAELDRYGAALAGANRDLSGVPGVVAALEDSSGFHELERAAAALDQAVGAFDQRLDAAADALGADGVEEMAGAFLAVRDAAWAIRADRVRTIEAVLALAGPQPGRPALEAFTAIQYALSGLDRLEVRGRDSAGIHVFVHGAHLDAADVEFARELALRSGDPLFANRAVHLDPTGVVGFVYKAAAEIGELGDNTTRLRAAIAGDSLLHRLLAAPDAMVSVVGHTRWASVGIISEPNAHPVNSEVQGAAEGPYVIASLNGDIDNYADLAAVEHLEFPLGITTDAKVIPALAAKRIREGVLPLDAFRDTVAAFEGSVAIAMQSADAVDDLLLALRGSGQGLFVGLADDCFIVASEPYGIVEVTDRYVRMDGETPGNPENPQASRGQMLRLTRSGAGELAGLTRLAYDGTVLPIGESEVQRAQITTRDINRGDHPHFLLKEISEAPNSFRKTLRGRLIERGGNLEVVLGPETLAPDLAARLESGVITRIFVIGQGTAAVAGQACARLLTSLTAGVDRPLQIEALPATELSGFRLEDDLSDTLVIAMSQSGTTTDTNRTVDLVRARGGAVIAIVNRRHSDLADRSDGVMYTSDGRDIEMSVASTKAFYAQVAAGVLLALAITARLVGRAPDSALLQGLREVPAAMERVLRELRPRIAQAAQRHAPQRRSWAVVGSGPNLIAAHELRIKCSELCYKAIACDVIEDKKHIDLSSEPLILV
jgi:glucosamine--fructose-6-phosphate aminotransferase (isomerizing)